MCAKIIFISQNISKTFIVRKIIEALYIFITVISLGSWNQYVFDTESVFRRSWFQ
jgi:hypothetical protein